MQPNRRNTRHGHTAGRIHTSTYMAWCFMRQLCNNAQSTRYIGDRVSICPQWDAFEAFLRDLGPRPAGAHLHRDKGRDFEPGAVRWVT